MEENNDKVYKDERYGQYREMLYSYNESGEFTKDVTFHGVPDRVILQQAWDLFNERTEIARQKVKAGKASPIVYYMEKSLTDTLNLSMLVGIPFWKVKLHFRPFFFKRMNEKDKAKYAEAFNISVDQLSHVD